MFATTFALINACYTGPGPGRGLRGVGRGVRGSAAVGPLSGGGLTQRPCRGGGSSGQPAGERAAVVAHRVAALRDGRGPAPGGSTPPDVLASRPATASTTVGLVRASSGAGRRPQTGGLMAAGAAAPAVFALIENRARQPLLRIERCTPAFAAVHARRPAGQLRGVRFLAPYTSLWLQSALGLSRVRAGPGRAAHAGGDVPGLRVRRAPWLQRGCRARGHRLRAGADRAGATGCVAGVVAPRGRPRPGTYLYLVAGLAGLVVARWWCCWPGGGLLAAHSRGREAFSARRRPPVAG